MRKHAKIPVFRYFILLLTMSFCLVACEDDYIYNKKGALPEGLNSSIYDYMKEDGHFGYFLRLIDDLEYAEILSRTGSKTLFPARDEAFERFFQSANEYHVHSYEGLSMAQKRSILNRSMLNMAYVAKMLSNVASSGDNTAMGEGRAIRKATDNTFLDSVFFLPANNSFLPATPWWERFREKGLYLLDDETKRYLTFFTPENRTVLGITPEDIAVITNNAAYAAEAYYVNGVRIIEPDIICKNGYIHVVEDVLVPTKNMDQLIRDNGETSLFSYLMGKFCVPYYSAGLTKQVTDYYDGSTVLRPLLPADSVFVKLYLTDAYSVGPDGSPVSGYGTLYFDPANNAYGGDGDMGVMFVPTDAALSEYFNGSRGNFLKDAYGTWDNVPPSILALFLKNHQKRSFLNSLPHTWNEMNDESSFAMNVKKQDIKKAYLAGNGVVYLSNTVYPPVDYQCVYASTLISSDTKIMNWVIQEKEKMKYYLYLRSMENMYNLIIPVDEAFRNYRDPVSWAGINIAEREIWDFYYSPEYNMIFANIYNVDSDGSKAGLKTAYTYSSTHQDLIRNRLNDIIDMHIVVGEKSKLTGAMGGYIDDGNTQYALTKSGATIKVGGSGMNTGLTGGGDLEQGMQPASILKAYNADNGKTFFIDRIIQDPVQSVYQLMGERPEFKAFFDLLTAGGIFSTKRAGGSETGGLGYVVNSFNNFRYTVFVPTKEALDAVFAGDKSTRRLWTWDEIADIDPALPDYAELRKEKEDRLTEFLKYHFMDNSAYINGKSYSADYETAARYQSQYGGGKFRKITVNSNGSDMQITGGDNRTASVIKTGNLYNLMARDYIVKYVTRGGVQIPNTIESSSRAVIHLIDNVLRYENE